MKEFCITYKEKTNTPSRSGVMPSEWFEAHSREDVPPMLYAKLKVTKGEFDKKYQIVDIFPTEKEEE